MVIVQRSAAPMDVMKAPARNKSTPREATQARQARHMDGRWKRKESWVAPSRAPRIIARRERTSPKISVQLSDEFRIDVKNGGQSAFSLVQLQP